MKTIEDERNMGMQCKKEKTILRIDRYFSILKL